MKNGIAGWIKRFGKRASAGIFILAALYFLLPGMTVSASPQDSGRLSSVLASPSDLEIDTGIWEAEKKTLLAAPQAEQPAEVVTEMDTEYIVNPLYRHILDEEDLRKRIEEDAAGQAASLPETGQG